MKKKRPVVNAMAAASSPAIKIRKMPRKKKMSIAQKSVPDYMEDAMKPTKMF